ncbi:MAG: aconitate hydratase [bacterium]
MFDEILINNFYKRYKTALSQVRQVVTKPLTLTEKLLYVHTSDPCEKPFLRGKDYVTFHPDRVAMQDATAQMALLQFLQAGQAKVAVPASVHCDHLIQAELGAEKDVIQASKVNKEVYDFLESVSRKYGIGFWKPGAGIIHQVVLENYAFPGGMMVGTDSHTVNAGGLGMIAIGVGGADAVDVLVGEPWELKFPKVIGVHLTGSLSGWTSSKDIILYLAGLLTVKGGTGAIVEYFGEGAESLSCTGKGTICNMGAEIGATTSIFPYDRSMSAYLRATDRSMVADYADDMMSDLGPDQAVLDDPEAYYDQVIHIDLSTLEPHVNGPFTPDKAWPLSKFAKAVKDNNYPVKLEVGLIGSCTNSSYEDISRSASIARQARDKQLKAKSEFTITPGSELVRATVDRDGLLDDLGNIGGLVLANACGPCIGQWKRHAEQGKPNSIITSFNRNFAKRNDGNPNTHAFVASPELVTAFVLAGRLDFNPLTDTLENAKGQQVKLDPPKGEAFSKDGFTVSDLGYLAPEEDGAEIEIAVSESSERLQLLPEYEKNTVDRFSGLRLLIKVKGKCTTDHISMAGPWLKFRGHLANISKNMFLGAINFFNDKANEVYNLEQNSYLPIYDSALAYKEAGIGTLVVGDENYGEGSSREHAAMEPRFMGVKVVICRSFARIHESNLKKQGVLAFCFANPDDYAKILERDIFDIKGLDSFSSDSKISLNVLHEDGTTDIIELFHTYNDTQIAWFKAGSALSLIKQST